MSSKTMLFATNGELIDFDTKDLQIVVKYRNGGWYWSRHYFLFNFLTTLWNSF